MKKSKKITIATLLFITFVVLVHVVMGYGYILKGVSYAYLRGQKGPGIKEHHLFYNYNLKSETPKKWIDDNPNLSISKKNVDLLKSIETAGFLVIKNLSLIHI
mgnify:FL=1